jgi:DNA (cytosine-5)-methyltransferase 1
MEEFKILNLYAGIGGNRKLWTGDIKVTAIENNPKIAKIYKDFFPQDEVIITDAHQFLLEHYKEYNFIWSSPPCPTHSKLRKGLSMNAGAKAVYPDMKLYEEILLLQGYFKGKWVVENVISWYKPLIIPQIIQRHFFWSNFKIPIKEFPKDSIRVTGGKHLPEWTQIKHLQQHHKIILPENAQNKRLLLRNCVNPEVGLYVFNCIFKQYQKTL